MSEQPEGHFHFIHPEGAPGALHQMLGDQGFKNYLEAQSATVEQNTLAASAYAALTIAKAERIKSMAAFINASIGIGTAAAIPVVIHLFRWAL